MLVDRKQLDQLVADHDEKRRPLARISQLTETTFTINDHQYQLDDDHANGFNFEAFVERYNPALSQFDYIIGDWGYGQLRLRGFYKDDREDETNGPFISALNDYLLERVNFGAAYFVIHNLEARPIIRKSRNYQNPKSHRRSSRGRGRNHKARRNHAFIEQKVTPRKPPIEKRKNLVVKTEEKSNNHHFIIRESKN